MGWPTATFTGCVLALLPLPAAGVTIVDGVAGADGDGMARLSTSFFGPPAGSQQQFEVRLFAGEAAIWSFVKVNAYIIYDEYDSELVLDPEDCFAANDYCRVGQPLADGLSFSGTLSTALPTPPNPAGLTSIDLPAQVLFHADITASGPVGYRVTLYDPVAIADVPEPATWLTMMVGFAALGTSMRRPRARRGIAA